MKKTILCLAVILLLALPLSSCMNLPVKYKPSNGAEGIASVRIYYVERANGYDAWGDAPDLEELATASAEVPSFRYDKLFSDLKKLNFQNFILLVPIPSDPSFYMYGYILAITYEDGGTIPSNVQAAYHSMGDGSKNYKRWLSAEVCPTVICCGIKDQYGSWDYWAAENEAYKSLGVDYLSISMFNDGHNYPNGIDTVYNYDRFNAMMDFFNYYLKGKENKIAFSSVTGGKLVSHDEVGTVIDGEEIFVQFIAPITKESAEQGITLYDETAKSAVQGSIAFDTNNRVIFKPASGLTEGHAYTLKIADGLKSTGGAVLEDGAELKFTY